MSTRKSTTKTVMGHVWAKYEYPAPAERSVLLVARIRKEMWWCEKCGAIRECKKRPPVDLLVHLPGVQLPNGRHEVTCDEAVVHKIMSV
jgi:hypothetical protein